jgi:hypothetical protein
MRGPFFEPSACIFHAGFNGRCHGLAPQRQRNAGPLRYRPQAVERICWILSIQIKWLWAS